MPQFLSLPSNRRIAYCLSEGALPGVIFLGGFRSDMTGTKAMALEDLCKKRGQRFIRFDYSGHGQSSGDFKKGTIGAWLGDALAVIDHLAPGKNILVGSSMGGWIMLLAALARPESVAGLVGIASAPDFTEKLVWEQFDPAQKKQIMENGVITVPDCYSDMPYHITRRLIEEAREHLVLGAPIAIHCPVRLLHGTEDADVPWQMSVQLMERLASKYVQLTLVKGAGHRMSEPEQIELMCGAVDGLMVDG